MRLLLPGHIPPKCENGPSAAWSALPALVSLVLTEVTEPLQMLEQNWSGLTAKRTTSAEGNGIPSGGHGIKFWFPKLSAQCIWLVSYRKIGAGHGTKGHFLAVPGRFGRARNLFFVPKFQWKNRSSTSEMTSELMVNDHQAVIWCNYINIVRSVLRFRRMLCNKAFNDS